MTSMRRPSALSKKLSFSAQCTYDEKQLVQDLTKFENYHQALAHLRSYPIPIAKKMRLLNENATLYELKAKNKNFVSKNEIKKVNKLSGDE